MAKTSEYSMKKCIFIWLILAVLFVPIDASAAETGARSKKENNTMDYEKLKIKSFKYWDLYLHENQCYLGRTFVQLKDESGIEDFLDIKGEMREEFFQIGQNVKKTLKSLFKTDKMNYAALSNTSPVIHMHIIPRYKEAREFDGVIFKDTRWGQNYAPYDRSFTINESTLFKIRDALKGHL
jgi:diadenosine tetraphosphate (Ap4A) HIT family hydrolase